MNNRGMTLIELIIVVAIIGILAGISVPAYIGQQKRATRVEAFSNLQNLRLLEEQFFAERSRYTISLGTAGKDHAGNLTEIRNGGPGAGDPDNALPGFRPGGGLAFSYWTVQNREITGAAALDGTAAGTGARTPCFIAFAQGNTGTRVAGETYAIDCNNNRNF